MKPKIEEMLHKSQKTWSHQRLEEASGKDPSPSQRLSTWPPTPSAWISSLQNCKRTYLVPQAPCVRLLYYCSHREILLHEAHGSFHVSYTILLCWHFVTTVRESLAFYPSWVIQASLCRQRPHSLQTKPWAASGV